MQVLADFLSENGSRITVFHLKCLESMLGSRAVGLSRCLLVERFYFDFGHESLDEAHEVALIEDHQRSAGRHENMFSFSDQVDALRYAGLHIVSSELMRAGGPAPQPSGRSRRWRVSCAICYLPGEPGGFIGKIEVCPKCYNDFGLAKERAEAAERLLVALDNELESDNRLVTARKELNSSRISLEVAERVLRANGLFEEYLDLLFRVKAR